MELLYGGKVGSRGKEGMVKEYLGSEGGRMEWREKGV